jgi:hypothetical protein
MLALLVLLGLLVGATAPLYAAGAGFVAVAPLEVLILAAGWMVWAFIAGRSSDMSLRHVRTARLLGPGAPDDPEDRADDGAGEGHTQGAPERLGASWVEQPTTRAARRHESR